MLTLDYLKWFLRCVETTQYTHHVNTTVYLHLFVKAASANLDYIPSSTQVEIAAEIGISDSTVSRSLKELEKQKIVNVLPNGQIYFLPPDIRWLQKRNAQSERVPSFLSALIPRAQETAAPGEPTLQGRVTPPKIVPAKSASPLDEHTTETVNRAAVAAKGEAFLQRMREQTQNDRIKRAIGNTFAR